MPARPPRAPKKPAPLKPDAAGTAPPVRLTLPERDPVPPLRRPTTPGLAPVAGIVARATRQAIDRKGMVFGGILQNWASIVGPALAAKTLPEALSFPRSQRTGATLTIRVSGAMALEVQHMLPLLLERVNGFAGYGAVDRIKLVQAPVTVPNAARAARRKPVSTLQAKLIDSAIEGIEDETLREALRGLGQGMASEGRL